MTLFISALKGASICVSKEEIIKGSSQWLIIISYFFSVKIKKIEFYVRK